MIIWWTPYPRGNHTIFLFSKEVLLLSLKVHSPLASHQNDFRKANNITADLNLILCFYLDWVKHFRTMIPSGEELATSTTLRACVISVSLRWIWVPGHHGIEGNEWFNELLINRHQMVSVVINDFNGSINFMFVSFRFF